MSFVPATHTWSHTTDYVLSLSLTTLLVPSAVPERPASVNVDSPNSTSINVTWTPPIVRNGILLGYEVLYKLTAGNCSSGDPSSADSVDGVALNLSANHRTYVIYGLKKYQRYCVFVRAYTSAGPGDYSYNDITTDPDSE